MDYILYAYLIITFIGIIAFKADSSHRWVRQCNLYCRNVWVGIDQLANAIILGDPDETLSSRIGKNAMAGNKFCIFMSKVLDFIDPGHTARAIERDEGKRQLTPR